MLTPAMEKYLMLQQMAQNQQAVPEAQGMPSGVPVISEGDTSPISKGSLSGIESAKRSLEMSGKESNRALGRSLMHFFHAMNQNTPQAGSGFAGTLGAINSGFLPALNAYDEERNRIAHENFALMKHEEDLRKQQEAEAFQRMKLLKDMEDQEREYNEMTAYQKGMLDLHRERQSKEEKEMNRAEHKRAQLESEGILPSGSIMFGEITDLYLRKQKEEEMMSRKDAFHPSVKNLKNLKQMEEIYNKHPNIWRNSSTILQLSNEEDPGIIKTMLSNINPKEQAAVQTLSKLIADINVNTIKQFSAFGRPTDMVKKALMKTMSEAGSAPGAFRAIKKNMVEENMRVARDSKAAQEAWKNGYYIPENLEEESEYLENYGKEPEAPPQQTSYRRIRNPKTGEIKPVPPNISDEDLQRLISMGGELME